MSARQVKQPTASPTRKVCAAILAAAAAGAVTGAINGACGAGIAIACSMPELSGWIEPVVYGWIAAAAGYVARERA